MTTQTVRDLKEMLAQFRDDDKIMTDDGYIDHVRFDSQPCGTHPRYQNLPAPIHAMKIPRPKLLDCLSYVERVTSKRSPMPILSMVRMEAVGGVLTIQAFNLELFAQASAPCDGDLAACCVSARRIIGLLQSELVEINYEAGWLQLSSGLTARLPCMDVATWPTRNTTENRKLGVSCAALKPALDAAIYAVSFETHKGALQYLHFRGCIVESADGKRLVRYTISDDKECEVCFPAEFAQYVQAEGEIRLSENWITFLGTDREAATKLADTQYPNYDPHVVAVYTKIGDVTKAVLLAALVPVASMVSDKFSGVRIDFAADKLTFSAESENGKVSVNIGGVFTVPACEATAFSPKSLSDAISHLNDGLIAVHLTDAHSPIVFKQGNVLAFCAPMRL